MTGEKIKDWLDSNGVRNYTINKDLTIDVKGNVDISHRNLREIPVQFDIVDGFFNCSVNKLISLKGSPRECFVFYCSNNKLTSLEFCPKCERLYCKYNNFENLNFAPVSTTIISDLKQETPKRIAADKEIITFSSTQISDIVKKFNSLPNKYNNNVNNRFFTNIVKEIIKEKKCSKKQYEHLSYLFKNGVSMHEAGALSSKN